MGAASWLPPHHHSVSHRPVWAPAPALGKEDGRGDAGAGAIAGNVYDELDREYEETEPKIGAKLLPLYTSPTTCSTECRNAPSSP